MTKIAEHPDKTRYNLTNLFDELLSVSVFSKINLQVNQTGKGSTVLCVQDMQTSESEIFENRNVQIVHIKTDWYFVGSLVSPAWKIDLTCALFKRFGTLSPINNALISKVSCCCPIMLHSVSSVH